MALFSKQNKEVFTNPLNLDHPILGQVLGICSALAVTSQLKPAIVMGLAVTVIISDSEGFRLRRQRSALCVCRSDHHQLYPDGSPRGVRHAEQALAFVPRWRR